MNREATRERFLKSATEWICDSCSLEINYLATSDQDSIKIIDASLLIYPLPPNKKYNFSIEAGNLIAGRETLPLLSIEEILTRLKKAENGEIDVNGLQLKLQANPDLDYYSENPNRETWFSNLHLVITGSQLNSLPASEFTSNDNSLRCSKFPFDGLADLCSYLQLSDVRATGQATSINLRVGPPVDLIFESSNLHENIFHLNLNAHSKFDTSKIGLATIEFPGNGLESRKQQGKLISWKRPKEGKRAGILKIKLGRVIN